MAAKKKATKGAAGALAAGKAARDNRYVRRLMEDDELREELRSAFESARKAYGRIDGKGPGKALEDKKVQRELKRAADSLKTAGESLRERPKRRKRGLRRLVMLTIVGGVLALALSEDLRKKALDALFGAEEEYEYSSTTTPSPAASPEAANAS